MATIKNIAAILFLGSLSSIFNTSATYAQVDLNNLDLHESKTFAKNPINVLQAQYIDSEGNPSHEVFLSKNKIRPLNTKDEIVPYFTLSILKSECRENDGKLVPIKTAEFLNLDFLVETALKYKAVNFASPIWDGRVYEENGSLIVGGYSSRYNERPVGIINSNGEFVPQLKGESTLEFPILQIPANEIVFDPFEWKLLRITAGKGEDINKNVKQFLPLDIYNSKNELLERMTFRLENKSSNSFLVLYGILDGVKIELASCNLNTSKLVKTREGFRPELIEGCSQPGRSEVLSLTFQGEFSELVSIKNSDLIVDIGNGKAYKEPQSISSIIQVDGDFQDWRNIQGVSDIQGDHVSYLYPNPDTDLLDFKVSNDDKYLYLYSRVLGAHGRTGKKGRYYWYVYIDIDSDPTTGYPPTRDDNCYFGIPIGDDSEAQFEFIANTFVKTFFGFTGVGAEKEVLSGELKLGPSFYSPKSRDGQKRDSYKIEYVNREGSRLITHDYTEGTSEDIIIALSPDASEVEVKVELAGFLKDVSGNMLMHVGKKIDIAVGVEGSSYYYNSNDWGADSSPIIYGYEIK